MEKIWNDFGLKKPPFIMLSSKYSRFIHKLHENIENFFSEYAEHEGKFNEAAALLSRLMARRKNSFKKMRGFKDICKLNAALCRILRIDFKRDLDSFRSSMPDVVYEEGAGIHLPTRESFDFLLIRLIALHELHRRINDCCLAAAQFFTCQIRLYFFFEISTLLLAVLAKIHNLNIKLANIAVNLYNSSLLYRTKLPINPKSKFLKDENFKFPEKLDSIKITPLGNEKLLVAKEEQLNDLIEQEVTTVKAHKWKKSDMGTEVRRSSEPEKFNIEQLNSVESIRRFIVTESKTRSSNLNGSITRKILSHEWAGATKLFERKVQSGEAKKATNIFRKFLSLKIV